MLCLVESAEYLKSATGAGKELFPNNSFNFSFPFPVGLLISKLP